MKKEIVEKLLNTISKDTSGKWINISEIETLIENTVRECIDVLLGIVLLPHMTWAQLHVQLVNLLTAFTNITT